MQRSMLLVIFCLLLWVTSCQSNPVALAPTSTYEVAAPTKDITLVPSTAVGQPTFTPTATETATPYPTRTPGIEAERATPTRGPRLTVADITPVAAAQILPTPTPTPLVSNLPGQIVFFQDDTSLSLWSFSLTTGYVSSLLPNVSNMAVLLQDELPYVVIAADEAIEVEGLAVAQFPLPELCLLKNRCTGLQFSPNGRYLGFTAVIDAEIGCGSSGAEVQIWDVASEEIVQRITGAGFSTWIAEDKFLYGYNGCEAGNTYLWDMESNQSSAMGRGGRYFWSPDGMSLAGFELTFFGFHADFWMYNIELEQYFRPQQGEGGRYDTLCWHPDSSKLAYTWQEFQPPSSYTFSIEPRELWVMEANNGEQHPLLLDQEYNYFIASGHEREWQCHWLEDWLQVRQVPYTPITTTLEPDDRGALYCPVIGVSCSNEVVLGVNTVTGEIRDWDTLAEEIQMPDQKRPDLGTEPIFRSLDSSFALYSDINNSGLWYVPIQGEPHELISDGFNFVYIPEDG